MIKTGETVANELPAAFCSGKNPSAQTGRVTRFFSLFLSKDRIASPVACAAPCPYLSLLGFEDVETPQFVLLW